MTEIKKNLVEEAFIQMKNVEEAISENAKGILASTMKEEINQLVKESLNEGDDEIDTEDHMDSESEEDEMGHESEDDMDSEEDDMDHESEEDMDSEEDDMEDDETPIDLTNASPEEVLKVFKSMGEDDGIIIKKDGKNVHLTDNDADVEYLLQLGESYENPKKQKMKFKESEDLENNDESTDDIINSIFGKGEMGESYENDMDESDTSTDDIINSIFGEDEMEESDKDEVLYEIEFDSEDDMKESDYMMHEYDDMDDMKNEEMYEYDDMDEMDSVVEESKKITSKKPKGVGLGSGPKFSYKKSTGGFKEDKKEGPKTMGTGKAKFEYEMPKTSKVSKEKVETKEAARTLGMGSKFRKGGLPKPRAHSAFNTSIQKESLESEIKMLREKNEEYRKALNIFRDKLNEVAIFNSNLAYTTRLFTEHSTTKKEKINILRRFDNVETLKESKNLYKLLKDELGRTETKKVNESFEKKINNTVSSGSSTTLIESKTYENPQFLRMKDLMAKIK